MEAAIVAVLVDGEVAHTERCEILEEVSALTWVYAIVLQRHLHDDTRCRYMRPLHGYAQPRIARTPPARTYKHVVCAAVEIFLVQFFYFACYRRVVGSRESVVGLHVHHIGHVFRHTMPERVVRAQQTAVVGYRREVFVEHLLLVDNGANLQ